MKSIRSALLVAVIVILAGAGEADARTVKYDLAPGEVSAPVTLRANVPITVVGVQTNFGFRGVGSVSLLSIPGPGGFIEWVGLHSTAGATITQGFSGFPGALILFLDFNHCVRLEVAGTAGSSQIAVRNTCVAQATGRLKITY